MGIDDDPPTQAAKGTLARVYDATQQGVKALVGTSPPDGLRRVDDMPPTVGPDEVKTIALIGSSTVGIYMHVALDYIWWHSLLAGFGLGIVATTPNRNKVAWFSFNAVFLVGHFEFQLDMWVCLATSVFVSIVPLLFLYRQDVARRVVEWLGPDALRDIASAVGSVVVFLFMIFQAEYGWKYSVFHAVCSFVVLRHRRISPLDAFSRVASVLVLVELKQRHNFGWWSSVPSVIIFYSASYIVSTHVFMQLREKIYRNAEGSPSDGPESSPVNGAGVVAGPPTATPPLPLEPQVKRCRYCLHDKAGHPPEGMGLEASAEGTSVAGGDDDEEPTCSAPADFDDGAVVAEGTVDGTDRPTVTRRRKHRLKVCSRCRAVYYCNDHCQWADWNDHRKHCVRVQHSD